VQALLDFTQWPAMVVTLVAAWLVASQSRRKRSWGFWCFTASNLLWVAWGLHAQAWALIALQVGLFGLNLRGASKNEPTRRESGAPTA
jgi:TctA family transporter